MANLRNERRRLRDKKSRNMADISENKVVRDKLLAKFMASDEAGRKKVIKTNARRSKVRTEYVGRTLAVFDGQEYVRLHVTSEMVGQMLSKLVPKYKHTASLRYVSIPPRKMRLVANLVKGMPIEKALNVLNFTPRIAARHIANTIKAAAANLLSIEGTSSLRPEDLIVKDIVVQDAPSAKRIRFQSMGRVYQYKKRHCHLSVKLDQVGGVVDEAPERVSREATSKTKAAAGDTKKAKTKKAPAKKTPTKKKATAKPAKKTAVKKTESKPKTTKTTKTASKKKSDK